MTKTGEFLTYPVGEGVSLHVYPAPALKSVGIHAVLHRPLAEEEATLNALLPGVLRRGCRRTPTQRAIAVFLEGLYGASFGADVLKFGERHCLHFHLETVNDRFAPGRTRILRDALDFLRRVTTAPVLDRGLFPAAVVRQERDNLRHIIDGLINERMAYATQRCIEAMCADEPYRIYEYGRGGDVDAATPKALREHHRRVLREAPIDIIVTGAVQGPEVARAVGRAFALRGRAPVAPPATVQRPAPGAPREVVERARLDQGKLVIGLRTGVRLADADSDAVTVANGILGGFPHSKLFRNVREREGLAYDARSYLDRSKGLLFIQAGIDPARVDTARRVILEELEAVRKGVITDEEWNSTRECLFDRVRSLADTPSRLAMSLIEGLINHRPRTLAEAEASIGKVTKDDVVRAAANMTVDTIYFLAPE